MIRLMSMQSKRSNLHVPGLSVGPSRAELGIADHHWATRQSPLQPVPPFTPRNTGKGWSMKGPYGEGLASHTGPESCVGRRKAAGEALPGAHADQLAPSRKNLRAWLEGDLRGPGMVFDRSDPQVCVFLQWPPH